MDSTPPLKLLLVIMLSLILRLLPQLLIIIFLKLAVNILAEEIPQVDIDPLDFLGPSRANSFMLFPASAAEIEEIVTCMNSSKASGPFSIPVCLLKLFYKNLLIISLGIYF